MTVHCVPLDAAPINAGGATLGILLVVGTFLAPAPAFTKLYRRKSLMGAGAARQGRARGGSRRRRGRGREYGRAARRISSVWSGLA